MASNPIFNCCNVFESTQNTEATVSSVSRNIYHKNKNSRIPNAPKASLKSLSSVQSLKGFQLMNRSSLSNQPSTVKRIYEPIQRRQNLAPTNLVYIQPFEYIPQNNQQFLTPYIRQPATTINTPRDKVRFSYSVDRNQQTQDRNAQTNIKNRRPEQARQNAENQIQKLQNLQKIKKVQSITQQPLSYKKSFAPQLNNKCSIISQDSMKLGGSKYTILSQDHVQQIPDDNSLKMEQSAILVNVFHPTTSQMQNWAINLKKQQSKNYSNKTSKFQI